MSHMLLKWPHETPVELFVQEIYSWKIGWGKNIIAKCHDNILLWTVILHFIMEAKKPGGHTEITIVFIYRQYFFLLSSLVTWFFVWLVLECFEAFAYVNLLSWFCLFGLNYYFCHIGAKMSCWTHRWRPFDLHCVLKNMLDRLSQNIVAQTTKGAKK